MLLLRQVNVLTSLNSDVPAGERHATARLIRQLRSHHVPPLCRLHALLGREQPHTLHATPRGVTQNTFHQVAYARRGAIHGTAAHSPRSGSENYLPRRGNRLPILSLMRIKPRPHRSIARLQILSHSLPQFPRAASAFSSASIRFSSCAGAACRVVYV